MFYKVFHKKTKTRMPILNDVCPFYYIQSYLKNTYRVFNRFDIGTYVYVTRNILSQIYPFRLNLAKMTYSDISVEKDTRFMSFTEMTYSH